MKIIEFETNGAGTSLPLKPELWPNKVRLLLEDGSVRTVEADLGPGYWLRIKAALEAEIGPTLVSDWPELLHRQMGE